MVYCFYCSLVMKFKDNFIDILKIHLLESKIIDFFMFKTHAKYSIKSAKKIYIYEDTL